MARTRAPGSSKQTGRFSSVPPTRVPRSAFDASYSHKTTIDEGYLYPLHTEEIMPGDTVVMQPSFFVRMATPIKPYMDGLHFDWQAFFVPFRMVWTNFVRMMGEKPQPSDHNDYLVPIMTAPPTVGFAAQTLSDYLGIPTGRPGLEVTSLYHRAYNLCVREWYRDENLQDPPVVDLDDGPDDPADYVLAYRGKRKDYFTGALPFAQKGEAVELPLGTSAPIVPDSSGYMSVKGDTNAGQAVTRLTGDLSNNVGLTTGTDGELQWIETGLEADLSAATAATINQMRTAVSLQRLFETDARGGTRYVEMVLAHFGVQSDDLRHLRPQLLATGSLPITPSEVPKTTQDGTDPQGNLAAFATGTQVGRKFTSSFKEHGVILLLGSVRADMTYQQGLDKRFTRRSRFEFFHPELANIGEDIVESRELYADGTGDPDLRTGDYAVWGYQPRYESYRHRRNMVTGVFRSNHPLSLDVWHFAYDFASRPVLNSDFIKEQPPVRRAIVTVSEPAFLVDAFFKTTMIRPMPMFGTPGLLRF